MLQSIDAVTSFIRLEENIRSRKPQCVRVIMVALCLVACWVVVLHLVACNKESSSKRLSAARKSGCIPGLLQSDSKLIKVASQSDSN